MALHINFERINIEHPSSADLLNVARGELISLLAEEIGLKRELAETGLRISEYEGYAKQALDAGKEDLASEIADKIASFEEQRSRQQELCHFFGSRVRQLKEAYRRAEELHYPGGDRLQFMLDRLSASAELEQGGEWLELDRKMAAAGIGKTAAARDRILERVRNR